MLQAKDRVAIDLPLGLEGLARRGQFGQPRPQPLGAGRLFHAEVDGIAKPSAARIVRADGLGDDRRHRAEGIEHDEIGPLARGPGGQPAQVGQVADAPTSRRPSGVELRRPAPLPSRRQRTLPRRHDDAGSCLPGVGDKIVVAQRQVRGQLAGQMDRPAVFQEQFAWFRPGGRRSGADDTDRLAARGGCIGGRYCQGVADGRGGVRREVLPGVVAAVAIAGARRRSRPCP